MKNNIIIIGIHQSHVGANAGGFIRLIEFIKYIPKDFNFKIIDLYPTIYDNNLQKKHIQTYTQPRIVYILLKKFFVLGVLGERIYSAFQAYKISCSIIEKESISIIYVPIGEFLHLYLPAILLKRKYPHIKLVVDILNFKVYKDNFISILKSYISKSNNYIISIATALVSYISFKLVNKTINTIDYIFTVSPQLVKEINIIYKRNTIDFTPSGVTFHPNKAKIIKRYAGVYVGRVTEQKGIFNLIQVWKEVVRLKPEARLIIAGLITPETTNEVNEKIKMYNLTENVELKGSVTEKEKFKIIAESQIFLHLANYEPLFPVIGILEGLTSGLPVAVYNMPAVSEELKKIDKNNFIYVINNKEIRETALMIIEILSLNKLRKEEIALNARHYAAKYDWSKISKIEWDVISSLNIQKEHN